MLASSMETGIQCKHTAPRTPEQGFTLIELLTVIAIIALLAALLIPGLARAKAKGEQVSCLSNLRQLSIAWIMYANDHGDRLVSNLGATEILQNLKAGRKGNWADTVLNWELDPGNTNEALNADGVLGPYVGRNARAFRCPTDRVVSAIQRDAGWTQRSRTYSMNAMVGDAGEFTRSGSNVNNPNYHQYRKITEFRASSEIFIFIEEHPDSINDGYFLNRATKLEWHDLPASWHHGSANLTFADGHASSRRWQPGTQRPSRPDGAQLPIPLNYKEADDFKWLMQRTSTMEVPAKDNY